MADDHAPANADRPASDPSGDDPGSADGTGEAGDGSSADSLDARLADIHRRTEELAERVANFRSETADLIASPDPAPAGGDAPTPDKAGRRHRPRPSAGAPLVFDDQPEKPAAETPAETPADTPAEPDQQADQKPDRKPDRKPDQKPDQKPIQKAAQQPEKPAKRARRELPKPVRRLRGLVIVAVIAVAAAWALRTFLVAPYYVPSASMEPTLHGCSNCNDDHVLVEKLSYDFHSPEREDIIVFDNPGKRWSGANDKVLIKRVIGVPGDRLQIRHHAVFVNGQRLDEPYLNKSCHGTTRDGMPSTYEVPRGDVFVMGDNRCDSEDSRMFGPVPIDKVIGKAFLIFWPIGRFGAP